MKKTKISLPPNYTLLDNLSVGFLTRVYKIFSTEPPVSITDTKMAMAYLSMILLTRGQPKTVSEAEVYFFLHRYEAFFYTAASNMKSAFLN